MTTRDVNMSVTLLLLLLLSLAAVSDSSLHKLVKFAPGYSVHNAPLNDTHPGKPLLVEFSINLRNVLGVNEKEQLLSLECSVRMFWRDSRVSISPKWERAGRGLLDNATLGALAADRADRIRAAAAAQRYVTLNPSVAHHFWLPDVFVDRAKDLRIPTYLIKPASLRVYEDSTLRYSSRINFDVACPMDFHRFPVDSQLCEVNLESFGHSSKQLMFRWKSDNQVNPNITLAQFSMSVALSDSYATGDYYDLSYPGVIMRVRLSRQIGYHVVQTYVPSVVFVALAWLSLFISPDSVPGRVGMGMTTLLTLTAMFGAVRQEVPRVSYVSFLDLWMVACILFVFACILEFAVVNWMLRADNKKAANKIELCGRIGVPLAFILFNVVYWPCLYSNAEEL